MVECGEGRGNYYWCNGIFFRINTACMFSSSPVKRQSTGKAIVAAPVSAMALIVPADLW